MSAQVIPLFDYFAAARDWTQRELAEFYRVESALIQAGLSLETERGLSDEGDPWFVFCRTDTGEAFIHFARIDGKYIAVGAALDEMVEGRDFAALVQEILSNQAWVMAKARNRSNVFLHPSALLIAIVGAAFFHSGEAKAAETAHARHEVKRHVLPLIIGDDKASPPLDANEAAAIVTSVLIEWGRLAPSAPSGGDILPFAAAAGAADLAAPAALGHLAPVVSDLAVQSFAQADEPAAPPAPMAIQTPFGGQGLARAGPASAASAPVVENALADALVLDTGATLRLPAPVAAFVSGAMVIEATHSEAASILQSANIVADLATAPATVAPSVILAGLVDHGQHIAVVAASAAQPSPVAVVAPPAVDGSPVVLAPPSPTLLAADDPHVTAMVLKFAAEVSTLDVAVSGHEIILYDGAIFHHLPAGTVLESMTFNFTDGSSISLVGTATELQALHLT